MGHTNTRRSAQRASARRTKPKAHTAGAEVAPQRAGLLADLPSIVTRAEAADACRVSERTIDRLVATGRLRALRGLGHSVRFARAELERVLTGGGTAA